MLLRFMDDIVLYLQVLEDEVRWEGIIGIDAADFCGSQNHDIRPFLGKKISDSMAVEQIQIRVRSRYNVLEMATLKGAKDTRPSQAAMTSYVYLGLGRQHI